jgi:hypothetical protein
VRGREEGGWREWVGREEGGWMEGRRERVEVIR